MPVLIVIMLASGTALTLAARTYTVQPGDTLWAICDFYFHNPYQWPRVWAYNPQIQNPSLIYAGQVIRP